jgi:hypothetical protein
METPKEAVTEIAKTTEATEATEVVAEVVAEEPSTPSHKKTKEEFIERPVPTLDADFWSDMLNTKREMDKAAKKVRYSNLVVFK